MRSMDLTSPTGRRRGAILPLLSLIVWPALSPVQGAERPNIILISVDTLRADHLSCYGYPRETTPFIDSLARKGVRFENAFANASWTLPSHLSLMTSRYPHHHGVENDDRVLPASAVTLAETLKAEGYSTTAFISWVYVSAQFGFDQGFDAYHELLPPQSAVDDSTHAAIKAEDVVSRVIPWADGAARQPFFLFLHLFDPHINYEPPKTYEAMFAPTRESMLKGSFSNLQPYIRGLHAEPKRILPEDLRRMTGLYDGEIRYVDDQLRRLFTRLGERGLLANTIIALTSDHGEELDDHGSMEGHQWTLYDEVLHVPLILCLPRGESAGTVARSLAQSIDIAPTLLAAAGATAPAEFQGRNLLAPSVASESYGTLVFSEVKRFNRKWSVRNERYKLIFTGDRKPGDRDEHARQGYELYDLASDPGETKNIYSNIPPMAAAMRSALRRWMAEGTGSQANFEKPVLTDRQMDRLRGMGYVEKSE